MRTKQKVYDVYMSWQILVSRLLFTLVSKNIIFRLIIFITSIKIVLKYIQFLKVYRRATCIKIAVHHHGLSCYLQQWS